MRECSTCRSCYPDEVTHCPHDGYPTATSIAGEPIIDARYQLDRRLGQGGMGMVYLARHIFLKTRHAIKVILPDLVGNDPMLVTRFRQEAMAAAAVRHQNIVAVTDFGVVRGTMPFLVMEYVKGPSLHNIMAQEGAMPTARALELMRPIAAGVSAAHRQGVIHRDLKPLNVMLQEGLSPNEGLKILDFGLAKIKSGELLGSFVAAQTTGLMGSPFYMAPEQWSDEEPTALSDLYSLGATLYQMLAAQVPFKGSSMPSIMKKHLSDLPPSFISLGIKVPSQVERVVRHALEKDPAKRPPSVEHFIQELVDAAQEAGVATEPSRVTISQSTSIQTTHNEVENTGPSLAQGIGPESASKHSETSTVVQGHLTLHMDKVEQEVAPEQPDFSATVALRYSKAFRHSGEHIFEELVLHKDYERLWRSFIHAVGGCNLLTGYGPFGGTSLVRCAIAKARDELSKTAQGEAALLIFYFGVLREDKASFELEATKFGLEHLNKPHDDSGDSAFDELKARAGQAKDDRVSLLNFSLARPLGETFFNPREQTINAEVAKENYDFSDLIADLNTYFREHKGSKALHQIISRLVTSKFLPSRVVFIIDRIKHLETLETLAASDFFSNRRIRVVVVSRKEDLDSWSDADNRLEAISFSKWYVPCLWNINFDKVLFKVSGRLTLPPENHWKVFLRHLEFRGRGSLGNIIAELREARNINFGEEDNFIDVANLASRADVLHNAWLQDLLELNWDTLLNDQFVGFDQDEKTDRARIGIYYLVDWLCRKGRFSREQIIEQARKTRVTISDDEDTRVETVETLLHVLTSTHYLTWKDPQYRVIWNKDKPPKFRRVAKKRPARLVEPEVSATEQLKVPPIHHPTSQVAPAVRAAEQTTVESSAQVQCGEELSMVKRLTKALASLFNWQPPPAPQASRLNTHLSLNNTAVVPGSGQPQQAIETQNTLADMPARPILKSVHETIHKKTEYFIDKDKLLAGSINMLIVFANPKGSNPLRLGEEDRIIRECIKRSSNRAMFREKIIHAARIKDVQRELMEGDYQIVQFSGHGAPSGQLAFEDESGQVKLVPQKALSNLLTEFPSIRCVILNACYSASQGKMISLGVPFTIAMNAAISDAASQHFARGFYDALGAGKDYQFAFRMGCKAISLEGFDEESTPTLFEHQQ
jgi:serine/threonine protein kinase